MNTKLFIILAGAVFYCSSVFSSNCDLALKQIQYFTSSSSEYKVQLEITNACAPDIYIKRELSDINLKIFKKEQLIASHYFRSGLWHPKSSKFFLRNTDPFKTGCLKGMRSVFIDIKKNFLTSRDGVFLNLENGENLNFDCN